MDRNDWAHEFLNRLSSPHTDKNAYALISWMQAEGGNALWNPLNTTQPMPGAWDYNWVHVKNYPDFETGMDATVKTILQTADWLGYGPIRDRLRKSARPRRTLRAVEQSVWGTGGLALDVLPYVQRDYRQYSSHLIAGS